MWRQQYYLSFRFNAHAFISWLTCYDIRKQNSKQTDIIQVYDVFAEASWTNSHYNE